MDAANPNDTVQFLLHHLSLSPFPTQLFFVVGGGGGYLFIRVVIYLVILPLLVFSRSCRTFCWPTRPHTFLVILPPGSLIFFQDDELVG